MHWLLIALLAPALYAATNHTDKYLISKYFKGGEVGALIIFSAIFSIFALPIVYLIDPAVLNIGWQMAILLALNGMLIVGSIMLYLYAMQRDEASFVVPFYQTIPIFGFILGYFILNEVLIAGQIFGSLLVILGAFVLAIQLEKGASRFRGKVVVLMLLSSLFYAINGVFFKLFALNQGFWLPVFWMLVGKTVLGIFLLLFISSYRQQFLIVIKSNRKRVLALNSMNETVSIVADSIIYFAMLAAPVALVFTVASVQPVFVLIYGILLSLFFPHISRESLKSRLLIQKIFAIILIIVGSYLLNI